MFNIVKPKNEKGILYDWDVVALDTSRKQEMYTFLIAMMTSTIFSMTTVIIMDSHNMQ